MEYFPSLKTRRALIVVVTCSVCYVVSLPFTCPVSPVDGLERAKCAFLLVGRDLSLRSLSRVHGEHLARGHRLLRSGDDWIYLWWADRARERENASLETRDSFRIQSFYERCENDVGPPSSAILPLPHLDGYGTYPDDRKSGHVSVTIELLSLAVKIITALNLVNSEALTNAAGGGFDAYTFPRWSTILGWIIFVVCILPIPLFFLISYIQQYQRLPLDTVVRSLFRRSSMSHFFFPDRRSQPPGSTTHENLATWSP